MIRLAKYDDLDRIMEIYQEARNYMEANGNPGQWGKNHPPKQLLEEDIGKSQLYVYTENGEDQIESNNAEHDAAVGAGNRNGSYKEDSNEGAHERRHESCRETCHENGNKEPEIVHGVFAFIIGPDPTYTYIEDGVWLNDDVYGTIHRIAGDGVAKGVFKKCLDFCKSQIDNLRIDTHHNNLTMQHLVEKNGFEKCGIVYMEDGSPRIAYQYSVG